MPENGADTGQVSKRNGKVRLLTRDALDGRTKARRQFDAIAEGIAADLGGEDQLSTVQRHLVEAFAGAAIHVNDINARLLMGEQIDIIAHSTAISVMVRVASRIGVGRVPRTVTPPNLREYLDAHHDGEEAAS
jgi:hypothetical protein